MEAGRQHERPADFQALEIPGGSHTLHFGDQEGQEDIIRQIWSILTAVTKEGWSAAENPSAKLRHPSPTGHKSHGELDVHNLALRLSETHSTTGVVAVDEVRA